MPRLRLRKILLSLLGTVAVVVVGALLFSRFVLPHRLAEPDDPFHIAGNLYYVGNAGVTAFLLTGPDGHVLIDGGFPESADAIMSSIDQLGFDIADVKILLNSHAHFDHAGGLRALQRASGAALWISDADADVIAAGGAGDPTLPERMLGLFGVGRFPAPRIDRRFGDGEVVELGPIRLTAHITAGHTPGCTSWAFDVRDGERVLRAVSICSLTVLPWFSFAEPPTYPGIVEDFERSFERLRELPADIFLASHAAFFDMEAKRNSRGADRGAGPFVDRAGYHAFIDDAEQHFRDALADARQ